MNLRLTFNQHSIIPGIKRAPDITSDAASARTTLENAMGGNNVSSDPAINTPV